MTIDNLYETTEKTLVAAHRAGMKFWRDNRHTNMDVDVGFAARACGWHGQEEEAFRAGYWGQRARDNAL